MSNTIATLKTGAKRWICNNHSAPISLGRHTNRPVCSFCKSTKHLVEEAR